MQTCSGPLPAPLVQAGCAVWQSADRDLHKIQKGTGLAIITKVGCFHIEQATELFQGPETRLPPTSIQPYLLPLYST